MRGDGGTVFSREGCGGLTSLPGSGTETIGGIEGVVLCGDEIGI